MYSVKPSASIAADFGTLQCEGSIVALATGQSAVYGDDGSGGQEMKFGIVTDPLSDGASAYYYSVRSTDPDTAGLGNKRCEGSYAGTTAILPHGVPFWFTTRALTPGWPSTTDTQTIWQWHDASNVVGLQPFLSAEITGNQLQIQLRYDYKTPLQASDVTTVKLYQAAWSPNAWNHMVVEAQIQQAGFVKIWMNGKLVANYTGAVGYQYASPADYVKTGIYHWTSGNAWDNLIAQRQVWSKGAAMFLDNSSLYYTWQSADWLLDD